MVQSGSLLKRSHPKWFFVDEPQVTHFGPEKRAGRPKIHPDCPLAGLGSTAPAAEEGESPGAGGSGSGSIGLDL